MERDYRFILQENVVELMSTSKTKDEWAINVDIVKRANGDKYPSFWFAAIVSSGLMDRVSRRWGGDSGIHIIIRGTPTPL